MHEYEACKNELTGRPKRCFETRKQAERQAQKTTYTKLWAYECKFCRQFHLTHDKPRNTRREAIPSAAKLRRKLAEAAAQIRHTEKQFAKLHARLARAEALEAMQQKQRELENDCIAQAIKEMVSRLVRV